MLVGLPAWNVRGMESSPIHQTGAAAAAFLRFQTDWKNGAAIDFGATSVYSEVLIA